jgi:hypothetical protein
MHSLGCLAVLTCNAGYVKFGGFCFVFFFWFFHFVVAESTFIISMSRREVGGLHFDGKEDTAGRRPRRQGMDSGQLNTRPFITPQAIQRSLRQLHRPSVPLVKKMIFHLLQNAHAAPQTDLIRSHFRYSPQALKDLFFHPELTGQLANLVRLGFSLFISQQTSAGHFRFAPSWC